MQNQQQQALQQQQQVAPPNVTEQLLNRLDDTRLNIFKFSFSFKVMRLDF